VKRSLAGIPPHLIRRVIVRGALFWVLMHMVLLVFRAVVMREPMQPAEILQPNVLLAVLFTAVLSAVEMEIRRERTFISNLAIDPQWLILAPAIVAATLDMMLNAVV
jgi:hypothetical protein